jgi:hypothetical protein
LVRALLGHVAVQLSCIHSLSLSVCSLLQVTTALEKATTDISEQYRIGYTRLRLLQLQQNRVLLGHWNNPICWRGLLSACCCKTQTSHFEINYYYIALGFLSLKGFPVKKLLCSIFI